MPEEIAVVGATMMSRSAGSRSPPLSSVIINDHQRGYQAAAVLDRLMAGKPAPGNPSTSSPPGELPRVDRYSRIDDAAVVSALRYIRTNACDGINVRDVVIHVPVSRSVLERRFRKLVGRSINEEIIRLRLNRRSSC